MRAPRPAPRLCPLPATPRERPLRNDSLSWLPPFPELVRPRGDGPGPVPEMLAGAAVRKLAEKPVLRGREWAASGVVSMGYAALQTVSRPSVQQPLTAVAAAASPECDIYRESASLRESAGCALEAAGLGVNP